MDISYLGHSCFKLKGKSASVVTDPFDKKMLGFDLPATSADIVTVSHQHGDHNATAVIGGTARREKPYIVAAPGEYEVNGVGVFGWGSFHDKKKGEERGKNTMYVIHIDGVRVGHLGDLGHTLSDAEVEDLGTIDVLLVPVGGFFTINAEEAVEVINAIQPSIVIPMHYKTDKHNPEAFKDLTDLQTFLKAMGAEGIEPVEKLKVGEGEFGEETKVVTLSF